MSVVVARAGAVIALVGVLCACTAGDEREPRPPQPTSAAAVTSPSAAAAMQQPAWLPSPWSAVSTDAYSTAAGTPSAYLFCGEAFTSTEPVAVAEQVLSHPSGRRARLVSFAPQRREDVVQLFKFSYASCRGPGGAASVEGPRNVWSYDGLAGGSEMAGAALRLVEVSGPDAARPDAEQVLDTWAIQS